MFDMLGDGNCVRRGRISPPMGLEPGGFGARAGSEIVTSIPGIPLTELAPAREQRRSVSSPSSRICAVSGGGSG